MLYQKLQRNYIELCLYIDLKPIGETFFLPTFFQNTKTHCQVAVLNGGKQNITTPSEAALSTTSGE